MERGSALAISGAGRISSSLRAKIPVASAVARSAVQADARVVWRLEWVLFSEGGWRGGSRHCWWSGPLLGGCPDCQCGRKDGKLVWSME